MKRDRFDELVSELLDGALDESAADELDAILAADPEKARAFVALHRQAAALRGELGARNDALFAKRVLRELALERERGSFVEQVMSGVGRVVRRPRRALLGLGAGAVAGVLLGVAWLGRAGREAIARVAPGSTGQIVRDGVTRALLPGDEVLDGDLLRTAGEGGAWLHYPGESTVIAVEAWSELVVRQTRLGKRIELSRGEVQAEVAPQPEGRPLVILSATGKAEVLGTRLKLSAGTDATRLEVQSGRVRFVRADGASVDVPARHYTLAGSEQTLQVERVGATTATDGLPRVASFSLTAADGDRLVLPGYEDLPDGAVIDGAALPKRFNLRANTSPERVGSVRFSLDGAMHHIELRWPYTLIPRPAKGPTPPWMPKRGDNVITAVPFVGSWGNGVPGIGKTVTLTFRS